MKARTGLPPRPVGGSISLAPSEDDTDLFSSNEGEFGILVSGAYQRGEFAPPSPSSAESALDGIDDIDPFPIEASSLEAIEADGTTDPAGAPTLHKTTLEAGVQITRDNFDWNSAPITFGFRTSGATYSVPGHNTSSFSAFSASEQGAARAALQFWSDVSGITFTDLGNTNNATILFQNYNDPNDASQAFAFYPGNTATGSAAGDVFMNLAFASTTINSGDYNWLTMIHEVGHALGLEHPGSYNAAPGQNITYNTHAEYIEDTRQYTVMSYFSASFTGANHLVYNQTPGLHDIAAIQRLYGANNATRTNDNVYGFNSNVGSVYSITSSSQRVVFAVWDAGGNDTLDFSGYSQTQTIDLRADHFSSVGGATYNVAIALGVTIESGIGGSGVDAIIGNEADNLVRGRGGSDLLTGGLGADRFVLEGSSWTDAGSGIFDRVTDYRFAEGDLVDLSAALAAAYNQGNGQPVSSLVHITEDVSGAFSYLQIDPDGALNGTSFRTVMRLDGLNDNPLKLILDPNAPAGVPVNTLVARHDINNDGLSDVLWRHTDGSVAVWTMHGSQMPTTEAYGSLSSSWEIAGSGDFNGDGRADILWRGADGTVDVWEMNGTGTPTIRHFGVVPTAWHIDGVGDFNGDGRDDILWRHDDGYVAVDEMNGTNTPTLNWFGHVTPLWQVAGVGDLNGDGRDDIVWRHTDGWLDAWQMNGAQTPILNWYDFVPPSWHITGTGDFNGDSRDDLLWRHDDGWLAADLMNGAQPRVLDWYGMVDPIWRVADTGDYNGDGRDDILWRHPDGWVDANLMNGYPGVLAWYDYVSPAWQIQPT